MKIGAGFLANKSTSGILLFLSAAAFFLIASMNNGDSEIPILTQSATKTSTALSMNGSRHPQDRNSLSGTKETVVNTIVARSAPEGAPMLVTLDANPRLF